MRGRSVKSGAYPSDAISDHRIDARDLACPLPVLKARKALRAMAPGKVLLVEATDPMAAIDIPHLCAEGGHTLLGSRIEGGVMSFLIERGGKP